MQAIIEFAAIEKYITELRSKYHVKITFTNGCFDVLHRGHVEYLEKAKQAADLLVVGLNSDDSVRLLKGADRPYISQQDRAFILSRLEAVDIVCIFNQATPLELIRKVKPDILAKGADYAVDQIIGRDFVEASGGKVMTIPLVPGRSSSDIIAKIRKAEN